MPKPSRSSCAAVAFALLMGCVDDPESLPPRPEPTSQAPIDRHVIDVPDDIALATPMMARAFAAAYPEVAAIDLPARIRVQLPSAEGVGRPLTVQAETADGRTKVGFGDGMIELPRLVMHETGAVDRDLELSSTFTSVQGALDDDMRSPQLAADRGRAGLAAIPCAGYWVAVNAATVAAGAAAVAAISAATAECTAGACPPLVAAKKYQTALIKATALFTAYYVKLSAWLGTVAALNFAANKVAIPGVPGWIAPAAVAIASAWLSVVVLSQELKVGLPAMTGFAAASAFPPLVAAHGTYAGTILANVGCTVAVAAAFWGNAGVGIALAAAAPGAGAGGGGNKPVLVDRDRGDAMARAELAAAMGPPGPPGGGPPPNWVTDMYTAVTADTAAQDKIVLDLDAAISPFNGAPMQASRGFDAQYQTEWADSQACLVIRADRNDGGPYDVWDVISGIGSFRLQNANAQFTAGTRCPVDGTNEYCHGLDTSTFNVNLVTFRRVCDDDNNNDAIPDAAQGIDACEDWDGDGLEDLWGIVADTFDREGDQGQPRSCVAVGLDLNLHYQDGQHPQLSAPQLMAQYDQAAVSQEYAIYTTDAYRDIESGAPIGDAMLRVRIHGKLRRPANPCYDYAFVYAPPWSPEFPGRWRWVWDWSDTANGCDSSGGGGHLPPPF